MEDPDDRLKTVKYNSTAWLSSVDKPATACRRSKYELESFRVVLQALLRNDLVTRFWQPINPVGIVKTDSDGTERLFMPPGPVRKAKFYWELQKAENADKLLELLLFYNVDYNNWAIRDDGSDDEDSLNSDTPYPSSLSEAIRHSPERAVFALFCELGLKYSTFSDQIEQAAAREEKHRVQKTKASSTERPLGQMPPKRHRNSSSGYTTEMVIRSKPSAPSASKR